MTLAEKIVIRDEALAAYQKALKADEYSIQSGGASRRLKNQSLETLLAQYQFWDSEVKQEQGTSGRLKFVTPRH